MKKIKKKSKNEQGLPDNVGAVMDSNNNYIMFTTFKGESQSPNDLLSSGFYREALQKLITIMDYEYFKSLKDSSNLKDKTMPFFVPQTLVYHDQLPKQLGDAVNHFCERYESGDEDDTAVLLRFFEFDKESDAYYPVHVGVRDGKLEQGNQIPVPSETLEETNEEQEEE